MNTEMIMIIDTNMIQYSHSSIQWKEVVVISRRSEDSAPSRGIITRQWQMWGFARNNSTTSHASERVTAGGNRTRSSEHEEKRWRNKQTNIDTLPKTHYVDNKDTKRSVRGRGKRGHHANNLPHRESVGHFLLAKTVFESAPRRREKLSTAGEGGKLAHYHQRLLAHLLSFSNLVSSKPWLGRECAVNTLVDRRPTFSE